MVLEVRWNYIVAVAAAIVYSLSRLDENVRLGKRATWISKASGGKKRWFKVWEN